MPSLRHFIRALAPLLTTVPSFGPQEAATPPLEDCNIDIAGSKTYGGSFGSQFCATQIKQGHFVSGLKFWHTIFAIHAIQITYTNGDTTTVGDQHSMLKTSEIEWDPSTVSIRQAWGWPIEKDNIMAIGVGLSDGRSIEMGLVGDDAPVPDNDMISGTLLGISGMQGGHGIEQITFHMLESKIKGGNIQNVTFNPTAEELNKRGTNADRGLINQTISNVHYYNRFEHDVEFPFEQSFTVEKSSTWTHTISNTWHLGASLEIEHEMNAIVVDTTAKEKLEFFWEHHKEKSNMEGSKETITLKYGAKAMVKPGEAIRVRSYMVIGHWNADWNGQTTVTFENGKTLTFPTSGTLKNIQYSEAWVHVDGESVEEMKEAILRGDGELLNENAERTSLSDLGLGQR